LNQQRSAVGNAEVLEDTVLRTHDQQLAVARQGHAGLFLVLVFHFDGVDALELHHTGLLGLDLAFLDRPARHAADMESTHGQLRAGFADGLGSNDADRHPFLNEVSGRQIHAIAQPADPQRRLASHGAAHKDLVHADLFDLACLLPGDHLVLADDYLAGDGRDRVPADAAADRFAERALDFFALVHHALGNTLRGAAVLHGDDDVLRHVRKLAG